MPPVTSTPAASAQVVATEDELLRTAPLPHERVVYWGSGSPQGTHDKHMVTDSLLA